MLSRFSSLFVYLVVGLAAAKPVPDGSPAQQPKVKDVQVNDQNCSLKEQKCCNQIYPAPDSRGHARADDDPLADLIALFGGLGIFDDAVDDVHRSNKPYAIGCSPMGDSSGDGGHCEFSPTCCTGNHFGGLISVGCSPITVNT
ncbi:hypothetical protein F5148DRAFT_1202298 [Russula earlei]|uniref:Uncharacterized protein n=1 Tax=Russula earlei TaxID=71964 RepID=A0ACC0U879_9AGAM|nr:hypothetical protein F5148DRAFT_1202298 [Russula earlei]